MDNKTTNNYKFTPNLADTINAKNDEYKFDVIGVVGINSNDKEKSFISSIIQCLSNTPKFNKYFISSKYKLDI